MSVTITSFTFDYSRSGSSGYLRSFADAPFLDPDGVFHPAQSVGGQDYLKEIPFTAASNVATVPTFTHPATWDEASGARSSVTFLVLDSNRRKVGVLVANLRIPLLPTPTTWGMLLTHNDHAATIRDTNTYTKQQTDYQIQQNLLVGGPATTSALGRVKVDTTPEDAASPIAVGVNSPLLASLGGFVKPQTYGAVADGTSHPLSEFYDTLAEAQAVYPFITSLTQQIDYAAVKKASNVAFGPDLTIGTYATPDASSTVSLIVDPAADYETDELVGQVVFLRYPNAFVDSRVIASNTATTITPVTAFQFDFHNGDGVCGFLVADPSNTYDCSQYAVGDGEHGFTNKHMNKPLYFPAGIYMFGDDTWTVRNLVGGHIYGAGRYAARLVGNDTVFRTDGIWYSRVEGISFESQDTCTVTVDIDGNVPGHPYATRGVQGVTWSDVAIDGGSVAQFAFALCRQGQSGGAG